MALTPIACNTGEKNILAKWASISKCETHFAFYLKSLA
jgi:hypothetical protein